jgi:hypothetical protein
MGMSVVIFHHLYSLNRNFLKTVRIQRNHLITATHQSNRSVVSAL